MENLITTYKDDDDTDDTSSNNNNHVPTPSDNLTSNETLTPISEAIVTENNENSSPKQEVKEETEISTEMSEDVELTEDENLTQNQQLSSEKVTTTLSDYEDEEDDDNVINSPRKKRRSLASFTDNDQLTPVITSNQVEEEDEEEEEGEEEESKKLEQIPLPSLTAPTVKKPKKKISKANSVWTKPTSRKGKKKNKSNGNGNGSGNCNGNNNGNHHNVVSAAEDTVLITPIPRFPDKNDDSVDMKICLSKVYKAEKVELTEDRLSAGSSKGYRMVRATRGVVEGAWYFEIKVVNLGETGHTRLGWSTDKGDLQAPVGYDGYSFGYRDVDGSKIHKALREKYGEEGCVEGDVIGCYINLPQGGLYAPKPVHLFWYKGQKYSSTLEAKDKEEAAKVVPGSEICFFKNGIFQGVAFKDLSGGRYYPAASMYTLPNQPNCVVRFNFGPDFEFFPQEFEDRPIPTAMIEVPYQQVEARVENGESVEK
ncbi:hypothetical protein MKW98_018458 [Papaver atlanticum]|uniref:B30.2/SPRY domain-containing protein n=1 Tax=Papaver atlanticum TaxID=357466 RepID=A0AAD4TDJ3_9MAGN|nr:hypothetical protein MKW98_018458 [Papaver atlanticum]